MPEQVEDVTTLLPDQWLARYPEHRSEDREEELAAANERRRMKRRLRRRHVKA